MIFVHEFPVWWGRGFLLAGLAVFISSLAATAVAQEADNADDEARTHFDAGSLHFDRGAYEEAQLEFLAAFELSGRPALLYNLFLTSERLAAYDMAVTYLERYLAEGGPDDELRVPLELRLDNLRERQLSRVVEVQPDAPARAGNMVPAIVAFAVAGGGLLTFAIAGGLALKEDNSLATTCGTSCSDEQVSSLNTRSLVADIGWITAVAAAIAGTVLVLTLGRPSEDSSRTTVGSWVLPTGGGVLAEGRF